MDCFINLSLNFYRHFSNATAGNFSRDSYTNISNGLSSNLSEVSFRFFSGTFSKIPARIASDIPPEIVLGNFPKDSYKTLMNNFQNCVIYLLRNYSSKFINNNSSFRSFLGNFARDFSKKKIKNFLRISKIFSGISS